jgi:GT2 family glycosyltransferase
MKKPNLSIIVLSYNVKDLLRDCLESLEKNKDEISFEVIVPDNASSDGSAQMVDREFPWVKKVIRLKENFGFAKGNNSAKKYVAGEYVLFLNADTAVLKNTLKSTVNYLNTHKDVGAISCKIELPNGKLDKDTRRSFITPWIGLVHIFLKLDRLFPKSKMFAKYWYGYLPDDKTHEVDVIQGAFFMVRKSILDDVGWFDEDYYLDGEDIDLCWKIKKAGWKIVYYPKVKIVHYKGASKGKVENQNKELVPLSQKIKFRTAGVDSMEKFVRKRLWNEYPLLLVIFVVLGIKVVKTTRLIRTHILG